MPGWPEFRSLLTPPSPIDGAPESFAAIDVSGSCWLAKDHQSCPCLIIYAGASEPQNEIRLEHLRIQASLCCEIQSYSGARRSPLTVLRCTSGIEEHRRLFVSLIGTIVAAVGDPASYERLRQVIDLLTTMFSSLARPAQATIQGLWGELVVIAGSRDPLRLVRAWHATTRDDFDFSERSERLEVKTTSSRTREHVFAFEQLRPPVGTVARIASLIVRPAGGGTNIALLVSEIERALASDSMARLKLHALVVETLGAAWTASAECRFDRELAANSLAFYDSEAVPKIVGELPLGVSRVTFVSDLSQTATADSPPAGSLFEVAMPMHRVDRRPTWIRRPLS